ncbi:unnamed protein product [Rodentolepis nana]|uniref:PID domain-containing protein n=1 Tax=Rodentolepis nana TaxID=102285 RepID=A0A0R3U0I1_RODNA|nr:unnamed protein product [Rodentolepis nana]
MVSWSREVASGGGDNFSEEILTDLPFPFASFPIPASTSYAPSPDKSIPLLPTPGSQMQGQIDACVQANITETSMSETVDSFQLDPDGPYPTMIRAKTGASTLPSTGNSSMNPMSLDYRTRTLSASSLHGNGSLDKPEGKRNGAHRNPNLISGFRKLHTAFRGAVNAVRSATKATKIFSQDEPSSEEDDEVIGNQGIRLRCSRKMKGQKEFLQIKLVQKLDNEHIGAIWAMRVSPCGRLLVRKSFFPPVLVLFSLACAFCKF